MGLSFGLALAGVVVGWCDVASAQPAQDIGVQPQAQPGQPIVVEPPASAAPAQPAQPPPSPEKPKKKPGQPEKEWYGWQTLGVDAGAAVLMIAGQVTQAYSVFDVGLGAYFFAPPVVHIVHGNGGPAFGSLGLRLVAPWVGVAIGVTAGLFFLSSTPKDLSTCKDQTISLTGNCDYESSNILLFHSSWAKPLAYGFDIGLLAGYLLAIGIDGFLISYEKVDNEEYGKVEPKKKWLTWSPTAKVDAHHGMIGIGGTF